MVRLYNRTNIRCDHSLTRKISDSGEFVFTPGSRYTSDKEAKGFLSEISEAPACTPSIFPSAIDPSSRSGQPNQLASSSQQEISTLHSSQALSLSFLRSKLPYDDLWDPEGAGYLSEK